MSHRELAIHTVARRAKETPDRIFLQVIGARDYTYDEFHAETLRWAHGLERLGIQKGVNVALMVPTSAASYMGWLAPNWLLAVPVPINSQYREAMLAYALNNCEAPVLLISKRYIASLAPIAARLEFLKKVVIVDGTAQDAPQLPFEILGKEEFLDGTVAMERTGPRHYDPHGIIYTSGTTGPSKGVLVPWGCIDGMLEGVFPGDRAEDYEDGAMYTPWPPYHTTGLATMVMACQLNLRVVLREGFSVTHFWEDIRAYGCTHTVLLVVAPLLYMQPPEPSDSDNPLRQVGMYPLIPQFRDFEKRFGVRVHTTFAMTELGPALSTNDPANERTCGRVTPGYEVRLVDDNDEEVSMGEVGQLIARHTRPWTMCIGYFKSPQATATAWRNGWFHTGDCFVRDEAGNFYFRDRMKDMLKYRGHNISSLEVELEAMAHAAILECACVGYPADWTGATQGLAAGDDVRLFVTLKSDARLEPRELMSFLISRMPRFMVPRYIDIVETLPKTPSMKIQKAELRSRALTANTFDRVKAGIVIPK